MGPSRLSFKVRSLVNFFILVQNCFFFLFLITKLFPLFFFFFFPSYPHPIFFVYSFGKVHRSSAVPVLRCRRASPKIFCCFVSLMSIVGTNKCESIHTRLHVSRSMANMLPPPSLDAFVEET
ncbi:uncharacterized protein EI90DRAFT_2022338 [Cantharellus anzutake]|uniref:uncharacterized protein n=1 Tax=Cantharellus anzutake TaxID=1750568 RepID=UPI0019081F22|nr:uncharacterized protein EI90DRAFT_2022338 [Cantharellus anzutake]KAF8325839.1 hypothetical protein EI90DRAFT_2022338 [Cantharellus anzutake]